MGQLWGRNGTLTGQLLGRYVRIKGQDQMTKRPSDQMTERPNHQVTKQPNDKVTA